MSTAPQERADLPREHAKLAIDTEFVSEPRYQALLCLVQIAVPDPSREGGVRTDVLDPLDEDDPFDPRPLAAVAAAPPHRGRRSRDPPTQPRPAA